MVLKKMIIYLGGLLGLSVLALVVIGIPIPESYRLQISQELGMQVESCRLRLRPSFTPVEVDMYGVTQEKGHTLNCERLFFRFSPRGFMAKTPGMVGIDGMTIQVEDLSALDATHGSSMPLAQLDAWFPLLKDSGVQTLLAQNIKVIDADRIIELKKAKIRLNFHEEGMGAKVTLKMAGGTSNAFKLFYNPQNHSLSLRLHALNVDGILSYFGHSRIKLGTPLKGEISFTLTPQLLDTQVEGTLESVKSGQLFLADLYPVGLPYRQWDLNVSGSLAQLKTRVQMITNNPTATFECLLLNRPDAWLHQVDVNGSVTELPHHLFSTYWPESLGSSPRQWVLNNLSQGSVPEASITMSWSKKNNQLLLETLKGEMSIQGMTVHYMDQMPEVKNVNGKATFDTKQFKIEAHSGILRDLIIKNGQLTFYDLASEAGKTHVDLSIEGPLTQMLEVADSPALKYPSSLGVVPSEMHGDVLARLDLKMPLGMDIAVKDVAVHITGKIKNASFSKTFQAPVGQLDFKEGNMALDITNGRMFLDSTAKLKNMPIKLAWIESFNPKSRIKSTISLKGVFSPKDRENLKLPNLKAIKGDLGITLEVQKSKAGTSSLDVNLDLTPSQIAIPSFYKKASGEKSQFTLTIPDVDHVAAHEMEFYLNDSKGKIQGTILLGKDLSLSALTIPHLLYDGSDAMLKWNQQPDRWVLDVQGKKVNIASFLTHWHDEKSETETTSWNGSIKLNLEELAINPREPLRQVKGFLLHDGAYWSYIGFDARSSRNGTVKIKLGEDKNGRILDIHASSIAPLSPLLSKEGYLKGGALNMHLVQKGLKKDPWEGEVSVKGAAVRGAPILAQILTIISPMSMVERLSGQGLVFSTLEAGVKAHNDTITLSHGQATNMALGITFEGTIDQKNRVLDIGGHVIPAYLLNSLVGKIPFVGEIIAGGKGQGIVSAAYHVSGSFDAPKTSVNPFSVLTPGFTRKLFEKSHPDSEKNLKGNKISHERR